MFLKLAFNATPGLAASTAAVVAALLRNSSGQMLKMPKSGIALRGAFLIPHTPD